MGTGIVVALRRALGVDRFDLTAGVVDACIGGVHGGVFFDVGANVGEVSEALLPHASKVVAIEADPGTFGLLQQRAGAKGAVCVQALVGPEGGERTWLSNTDSHTGSTSVAPGDDPQGHDYLVRSVMQCRSLDSIAAEHGWPSLVKVDVEGFELGVLDSAKEVIARRAAFVVEFNAVCLSYFGRVNPRDALERLQAIFPRVQLIGRNGPEPITDGYAFLSEHMLKRACVDNLLCDWGG